MLMYSWLFFLLPVAALSGWLAARSQYRRQNQRREAALDPDYFKGLNYLLNEQPDKAIDVFIGLLEVDSETVETHLALANLFRRRGETERAIRIHQNLIARPTLTSQQRTQALVELGLDYMNAGVLDRAEQLFSELLNTQPRPAEAPKQLLRIYQQEKNWPKAIKIAKLLPEDHVTNAPALIAQFYCEQAADKLDSDKITSMEFIRLAHQFDKNCSRASLLEGAILIEDKQFKKAQKVLKQIEQQNIDFLPEALPLLHKCYLQSANLPAFKDYLQQLLQRYPQLTSARLTLSRVIRRLQGDEAAQSFLHHELHQYPSVEGLHQLMSHGENHQQELPPLIRKITTILVHKADRYTCKNCGFSGRTLHWHCPGCTKWASMRPVEIHLSALEKLLERNR